MNKKLFAGLLVFTAIASSPAFVPSASAAPHHGPGWHSGGWKRQEESIDAALKSDPRLSRYNFDTNRKGKQLTIKGKVHSERAHRRALDIVRRFGPSLNVIDRISVGR